MIAFGGLKGILVGAAVNTLSSPSCHLCLLSSIDLSMMMKTLTSCNRAEFS